MILAFVHGGYTYKVEVQGPQYEHTSATFPSIYHARFWVASNPEAHRLMPCERLVLKEIETGRYEVIEDNGFAPPEAEEPLWLKEGF